MSYPKQHPIKTSSNLDVHTLKKTQKRDQIKQMLINKFRLKYAVKPDVDAFDQVIRDEVNALMVLDKITEGELMKLDKRLSQKVLNNPEEAENFENVKALPASQRSTASYRNRLYRSASQQDDISIKSQQKKVADKINSPAGGTLTPAKLLDLNTLGQEAWADIVKYNTQQFYLEEEAKKQKMEEQKRKVRDELAK